MATATLPTTGVLNIRAASPSEAEELIEMIHRHENENIRSILRRHRKCQYDNNNGEASLSSKSTLTQVALADALVQCVTANNFRALELLLLSGADPSVTSSSGESPLVAASVNGRAEMVRALLKPRIHADSSLEKDATTALIAAIDAKCVDCARILLKYGACVNRIIDDDERSTSPLGRAICKNDIDMVRLLLSQGAEVPNNFYPLVEASKHSNPSIVRLLLDAGYDVAKTNMAGEDALWVAVETGQVEITLDLIKRNAINNMTSSAQSDLLLRSVSQGNVEMTQTLLRLLKPTMEPTTEELSDIFCAVLEGGNAFHTRMIVEAFPNFVASNNVQTVLERACANGNADSLALLVDAGVEVKTPSDISEDVRVLSADAALISAVRGRHLNSLQELLSTGAVSADVVDEWGRPVVIEAIRSGNSEIVEALLRAHANPDVFEDVSSALVLSIKQERNDIVSLLLEHGADPNLPTQNVDWKPPIIHAIHLGRADIVNNLLTRGANANISDKSQTPALIHAIERNHANIVSDLLNHKSDPNVCSRDGKPALVCAIEGRHANIVSDLLGHGATADCSGQHGKPALVYAIETLQANVVSDLLNHCADPNARTEEGKPAFIYAIEHQQDNIVWDLLQHGVKPDIQSIEEYPTRNPYVASTLSLAIDTGNDAIIYSLLEQGASVTSYHSQSESPLVTAMLSGNDKLCIDLLARGANANVKDGLGDPLLISAIRYGNENLVNALLLYHADPTVSDEDGDTALTFAIAKGHEAIARHLLDAENNKLNEEPSCPVETEATVVAESEDQDVMDVTELDEAVVTPTKRLSQSSIPAI